MTARHPNGTRAGRRLAARVKAEESVCGRCGKPIDPDLHWQHPQAFTLGHIIPYSQRPDLALDRSNVRAEHRSCNRDTGDRDQLVTPSEDWTA